MYIDSHVHVGDATVVERHIMTSTYRHKIRLYSALNHLSVQKQEQYLSNCYKYIGMPIILKEIDVSSANIFLEQFANLHKTCVPAFLVGDNTGIYIRNKAKILKEHFLHHSMEEVQTRMESYEYLNNMRGYLLLHSSDSARMNHIMTLRQLFPNMRIIIAHMGRNVYEEYDFSRRVIDAFKNDMNVFFDTSTIKNPLILNYAYTILGDTRILFGTDFPYEVSEEWNLDDFFKTLLMAAIPADSVRRITYYNALKIIEE